MNTSLCIIINIGYNLSIFNFGFRVPFNVMDLKDLSYVLQFCSCCFIVTYNKMFYLDFTLFITQKYDK